MSDYICPRCRGNNISNDLCIICGAYVAPEPRRILIRSVGEDDYFKSEQARQQREAMKATYFERLEHAHALERARVHKAKLDPEKAERYRATNREYLRQRRQREKAAKYDVI